MRSFKVMIILIVLAAIGGGVFIWSGTYNVAANVPHWDITHQVLEQVRERSVAKHSKGIAVPPLQDRKLKEVGFREFHEMCVRCHGAPGVVREGFAMGMYPAPPDLASGNLFREMGPAEIFWVIKNGLKMTGMPAFGVNHEDDELWGIVAFLEGLPKMTPQEYTSMAEAFGGSEEEDEQRHGEHRHE
jgi:mono/diheme cytochrome c family protein